VYLYEVYFTNIRQEASDIVRATRTTYSQLHYDFFQQVRSVMSPNTREHHRRKRLSRTRPTPQHDMKNKTLNKEETLNSRVMRRRETGWNRQRPGPKHKMMNKTGNRHSEWTWRTLNPGYVGCFSRYIAQFRPQDLNVTNTDARTSQVDIAMAACPDELFFVVLVAHLNA
ncbi:unnamed protein product, partial [Meganyctiphanes norvegica]